MCDSYRHSVTKHTHNNQRTGQLHPQFITLYLSLFIIIPRSEEKSCSHLYFLFRTQKFQDTDAM